MGIPNELEIMEKKFNNPDIDTIEPSDIAEFYSGCNVLITGGSGFVGKLVIEKLLRTCTKVEKLYVLMRAKKGKSSGERFKELFAGIIYDRLREEQPNFMDKVVMIEGQLGEKDLALSDENRKLLRNSHIVIHAAATVKFDEKLRNAVNINVRGTKDILLLAKEMPNLKAIVHIGTAFSHCVDKDIDEIFYKPPIGGDEMLALLDILEDETLEIIAPGVVGKWPNTYAFSKSLGEDIVRKYSEELPICIVRPSIMIATYKEPLPGWIDNYYGATGVAMGAAAGLLRTLHCDPNNVADMIPADYVINNIIAAAWDIGIQHNKKKHEAHLGLAQPELNAKASGPNVPDVLPIYNCVSSCQNPITWGKFMEYCVEEGLKMPSIKIAWYYGFRLHPNAWIHKFFIIFTHLLPAVVIDTLLRLSGRKPILLNAYKKIHKFSDVIAYFCTQQWHFRNNNILKLWDKVSSSDRKLFNFNMENLDWKDYYYWHMRGMRIYLMDDPLDTVEHGRRRYQKLKYAHYTLVTLLTLFFIWILYLTYKLFF